VAFGDNVEWLFADIKMRSAKRVSFKNDFLWVGRFVNAIINKGECYH